MAEAKADAKENTILTQFLSYEEYLDSQIKEVDEFYLEASCPEEEESHGGGRGRGKFAKYRSVGV